MTPPTPPELAPEVARIGPYRLLDRLAVGGMAEVHRALAEPAAGEERAVVVKRMLPELLEHEACVRMFRDEARIGATIHHPNVVEVLGYGQHEGAPYIALEYVFGVDLRRLLRTLGASGQALRPALAIFIASRLLAGLEAVHGAVGEGGEVLGVVHRDVSPSNVFLSVHGEVKLGDLGIARAALLEHGTKRPAPDGARGKLGYLAPEQLEEREVDARSDIFAAAAVTAELLMGRPLFSGPSELSVLLAVREADLSAFEPHAALLPAELREALFRALARDPEQRTPRAGELREVLEAFVHEPAQRLERELGALVRRAHEAASGRSEPRDRAALARTVEADARALLALSPQSLAPTPTPRVDFDPNGPTASIYEVQVEGRAPLVMGYAELVAALVAGAVAPSQLVAVNSGEPRPVHRIPELVRHLLPSAREPVAGRARLGDTTELFDLSLTPATEVFGYAYRTCFSGLAVFEAERRHKDVHFDAGVPIRVASAARADLLGQRLVAEGALSASELDLALALMPRYEGRLGDTLLALGSITAVALFRALSRQALELLSEVHVWPDGRAAFYGDTTRPPRGFPIEISVPDFLREGIARRAKEGLPLFSPPFEGVRLGAVARSTVAPGVPADLEALRLPFLQPKTMAEALRVASREQLALLLSLGALRWVA